MSYRCSNGHQIDTLPGVKIKRCPLAFCNSTELKRVGEGAVRDRACDGSHKPAEPIRRNSRKGHCDVCDKNVALTKDGTLRTHDGPHTDDADDEPEAPPEEVTFAISYSAFREVKDGGWPNDNPRGWKALKNGDVRKRGKGHQVVATLLRDDAIDLSDYLDSIVGAVAGMTSDERQGSREHIYCAKAREAIDQALMS